MLIYRNDGKLHCVSKKALKLAGYSDISQFLHEHNDYSELFIKKPGYIYNFENFSWLSFLKNAKTEQKKVLIATSDKATYECELSLEILFPVDFDKETSEYYYQIEFNNMRLLTGSGDTVTTIEVPDFGSVEPEAPAIAEPEFETPPAAEAATTAENETPDTLLFETPESGESDREEPEILFGSEAPVESAPRTSDSTERLELVDFSFGDESEERKEEIPSAEPADIDISEGKIETSLEAGTPDIGLKEDILPSPTPAETTEKETIPEPTETTGTKEKGIEMPDIRKVSGTLGLPETMVKAFVKEFVDTYFGDIETVRHAMAVGETVTVKQEAMKLKGIAANLMMHPLTETLEEILSTEEDTRIREIWSKIDRYMQSLASLYAPETHASQIAVTEVTEPAEAPAAEAPVAPEAPEAPKSTESEEEKELPAGSELHLEMTESDETIMFDPAEAADALGLPESLIIEFVNDFVQQADEERAGFEKAYADGDIKTINETAHKLKGVAANLRIEDMRQLMENAQHAKTLEEIEKSLTAFYRKLAALKRSMAKEYA